MTREEAIRRLKEARCTIQPFRYVDEAIDYAIKALENFCEDCISRQAVLNTLDTADKFLDEDRTVERYKAILTEAYEVLLSTTLQESKTEGDCISRAELLKAVDTWDKFGFDHTGCFVRDPKDDFITYVHYDDVIKCIKGMPSVQQEPKTEGDCISRQDLLKKCVYAPIAPVIKGDSVHYEDVVFARDIINAEPIQPKAKTGRWIDTGSKNFEFHKVYKCSKCGTTEIEYPESIYRHLRYCPNCGCKMSEISTGSESEGEE